MFHTINSVLLSLGWWKRRLRLLWLIHKLLFISTRRAHYCPEAVCSSLFRNHKKPCKDCREDLGGEEWSTRTQLYIGLLNFFKLLCDENGPSPQDSTGEKTNHVAAQMVSADMPMPLTKVGRLSLSHALGWQALVRAHDSHGIPTSPQQTCTDCVGLFKPAGGEAEEEPWE